MAESRFSKALKVWHGSPYDWDKPDPAKALTGEGAQVYGHGSLYVAEAQPVAEEYMRETTKKRESPAGWMLDGVHFSGDNLRNPAYSFPHVEPGHEAMWELFNRRKGPKGLDHSIKTLKDRGRDDAAKWLIDNKHRFSFRKGEKPPGRLYELELGLEDHEILDWDDRIHEHHPEAAKKILSVGGGKLSELSDPDGDPLPYHNYTGSGIYHTLASIFDSPVAASKALQDAGIQAIRYKDQGSRSYKPPKLLIDGKEINTTGRPPSLPIAEEGFAHLLKSTMEGMGMSSLQEAADYFKKHAENWFSNPGNESRDNEYDSYRRTAAWYDQNKHRVKLEEHKPTYNYVVFDPSRIRVLRKYGIKGQLVEDLTKAEGPVVLTAQPGRQKED